MATWRWLAVYAATLTIFLGETVQVQAAVGRTAGTAAVSQLGDAQYSVPLVVPAGTHGMTPQLSLNYNHRSGDSLLGVGWSLGGFSTISRCYRTLVQDAAIGAPGQTAADAYCLDGSRLRLTGGTYGAANSTYQTEIERFSRVRINTADSTGPLSWEVYTKEGLIYEYGYTADSRIESLGVSAVRTWAVSKIRDRAGNYIQFTYLEDTANGSYRPNQILYSGHSLVSPPTKVVFVYEARSTNNYIQEYFAGGKIEQRYRIDRIEVQYNSTFVRKWELTYAAPGTPPRSRLASVQECNTPSTPADCISPISFAYGSGTSGLESPVATSANNAIAVDLNGDGREDVAYYDTASSVWKVMWANSSGSLDAAVSTGFASSGRARPVDSYGNGKQQVAIAVGGGNWWLLGHNGTSFITQNTGIAVTNTLHVDSTFADVDGDGRDDFITGINKSISVRLNTSTGGTPSFAAASVWYTVTGLYKTVDPNGVFLSYSNEGTSPIRRLDLNGDGRAEVYMRTRTDNCGGEHGCPPSYTYSWVVLSANGPASFTSLTANTGFRPPYFGDFNGDGLVDAAWYSTTWSLRFGTGSGVPGSIYSASVNTGQPFVGPEESSVVIDWDGDGLSDLLYPNAGAWWLLRSNGTTFEPAVNTGMSATYLPYAIAVDIDGKGMGGMVSSNGTIMSYQRRLGERPDALTTVTDGLGNTTTFSYQRTNVASGGCYSRSGAAPTFPVRPFLGALRVVCSVTASNGIGGTYTTSYTYQNANLHLQGRGFLGFGKRTESDSRNGLLSTLTFKQDYPYTGAVASELLQQSGGTTVREVTNTWAAANFGTGATARSFPYVQQSVAKDYEAGGTINGQLLRTTTTTVVMNTASGTASDTTTTVVEGNLANGLNAGGTHTNRVYHSSLLNDTTHWCLGRPQTTEVTNSHTLTSGTAITRTTNTVWDELYCRPTQRVVEPASATVKVTTDLGYDNFGNVNTQTVTGVSMTARTTTTDWGTDGRFPLSITYPLTPAISLGWDTTRGWQTSQSDGNGLVTSWQYDGYGRRTKETRPDGTYTTWGWATTTTCGSRAKYAITEGAFASTGGTAFLTTHRYFDSFERPIFELRGAFAGGYDATSRTYDVLGRVATQGAPFASTSCSSNTPLFNTTYTYDVLSRQTQSSRPLSDSDSSPQTTTTYYEGLTTRQVDAMSKQAAQVVTAIGTLARSTDHNGYYQSFDYDAFGNLKKVADSLSNVLQSAVYNVRGMRTSQTDMDLGTWSFTPDALGEVISQTDAKSQTTTFEYDTLGRMKKRTEPEGISTFTFGTSATAHNIGKLASTAGPGYSESYTYDAYGRPQTTTITADATYAYDYAYNTQGMLDTLTYPVSTSSYRLKLQYEYQAGRLLRVKDFNAPTTVFWQANALDARGNVIDETLGNGIQTIRGYDSVTGRIDYIQSGPGASGSIQDLSYEWDSVGNLKTRQDVRQSLTERFYYDNLHRLDYSTRNGTTNLDVAYDALGNITSRSDVGTYTYHASKKHAVISTSGTLNTTYTYDNNGNMLTRNGVTTSWFSYNLPNKVSQAATVWSQFSYTPTRQRWKQQIYNAGNAETWYYIGGLLEKRYINATNMEYRHQIKVGNTTVAIYKRPTMGAVWLYYVSHDHLGSTNVIMNSAGAALVDESFAAFGSRRGSTWTGVPTAGDNTQIGATTRHGFTDHEHMDHLSLIHMNGRMFDPVIGRFMSADPYVQDPTLTQSFNRYSYVLNNPLSYTDPTGFGSDPEPLKLTDGGGASPGIIDTVTTTASRITERPLPGPSVNINVGGASGGRDGGGGAPTPHQPKDDKKDDDKSPDDSTDRIDPCKEAVALQKALEAAMASTNGNINGLTQAGDAISAVQQATLAAAKSAPSQAFLNMTSNPNQHSALPVPRSVSNYGRLAAISKGFGIMSVGVNLYQVGNGFSESGEAGAYALSDFAVSLGLSALGGPGVAAGIAYNELGGTRAVVSAQSVAALSDAYSNMSILCAFYGR